MTGFSPQYRGESVPRRLATIASSPTSTARTWTTPSSAANGSRSSITTTNPGKESHHETQTQHPRIHRGHRRLQRPSPGQCPASTWTISSARHPRGGGYRRRYPRAARREPPDRPHLGHRRCQQLRPDLDDDQAWAVLQEVEARLDCATASHATPSRPPPPSSSRSQKGRGKAASTSSVENYTRDARHRAFRGHGRAHQRDSVNSTIRAVFDPESLRLAEPDETKTK